MVAAGIAALKSWIDIPPLAIQGSWEEVEVAGARLSNGVED